MGDRTSATFFNMTHFQDIPYIINSIPVHPKKLLEKFAVLCRTLHVILFATQGRIALFTGNRELFRSDVSHYGGTYVLGNGNHLG